MFGCSLPVCALTYACIGELVSHEHNGLLFASPEQLAQQLLDAFRAFDPAAGGTTAAAGPGQAAAAQRSKQQRGGGASGASGGVGRSATPGKAAGGGGGSGLLDQLRRGAAGSSTARWHDSWQRIVLPVLEGRAPASP